MLRGGGLRVEKQTLVQEITMRKKVQVAILISHFSICDG